MIGRISQFYLLGFVDVRGRVCLIFESGPLKLSS